MNRAVGRHNAGFSMVELLVASTIGLFLVAGMISVFAGNRKSAELNTAMSNLQETARFALKAMTRDIRLSGYQGCLDINNGSLAVRTSGVPSKDLRKTSTSGSVVLSNSEWDPEPLPEFDIPEFRHAVIGTQTLQLQFGNARSSALTSRMSDGHRPNLAGPLRLERSLDLQSGDLAIVANCDTGDLFRVSGVSEDGLTIEHKAPVNDSGNLTLAYGDARTIDQTQVMRFESNIYYVGATGLENEQGDPVRALYKQTLPYDEDNPPVELVRGVEDMRVRFGIRERSGSLRYVLASDDDYDPARVDSVQIGLLMVSWQRIDGAGDDKSFVLAGQVITASDEPVSVDSYPRDGRFRLAFNNTVKVRNRRDQTRAGAAS